MSPRAGHAVSWQRSELDADVAIIGFGPVGSVLAAQLGVLGVRTIVVDKATEPYDLPRATYFDREIMRIFQAVGYADQIREIVAANTRYGFYSADGEVLTAFDHHEGPTPWGMPTGFNFYQPDLEKILRHGAERPSVSLRLGCAVVGITQDDDAVTVTLAEGDPIRAGWVIGCDGGSSTVRRAVDIELEDLKFDEPWIVLDAFENRPLGLPERQVVQRCDPARPSTFIPSVGRHRRWEFMLMPGEDPEQRTSVEGIRELLATWDVEPGDVEVVRAAVYRFHALIATEWRRDRVLLAGDAAHQMPPFFGQGMCAGIRDVANLAWKLKRVVDGTSTGALLDTYEQERRPHVRSIIDLSVELGRVVCTIDPVIAATRDAQMRAEASTGSDEPAPDPLEFIPPLTQGIIYSRGGADDPAGQQFIQPLISTRDGRAGILDDIVGHGFRLLGWQLDPRIELPEELSRWWESTGATAIAYADGAQVLHPDESLVITDTEGFIAAWMTSVGATVALLRPDNYVFGVAQGAEATEALVADLRRQLSPIRVHALSAVSTSSQEG